MKISTLLLFMMLIAGSSESQNFTEVSDSVGLTYSYPGMSNFQIGGGVTVFDFNNDGWDDIFQSGGIFPSKLWRNNRGRFTDFTDSAALDKLTSYYINGAIAADFNNDGWEDLFVYNFGIGQNKGDKKFPLLLYNHQGKFTETAEGFSSLGFFTSAAAADVNNDGLLDIYITNYVNQMELLENNNFQPIGYNPQGMDNKLYIQQNDGSFKERAALYNVADSGCGLACMLVDINGDFKPDILLSNDFGEWTGLGNKCYVNKSNLGLFIDLSDSLGFNAHIYGMGIGMTDVNANGKYEFYFSNIGEDLFLTQTNGKWVNKINGFFPSADTSKLTTSWSPIFFDMDNDGDDDLYLTHGNVESYIPKTIMLDSNRVFENLGDGHFVEVTQNSVLRCPMSHRGAAKIDYDRDGDIDLVSLPLKLPFGQFANFKQRLQLYRNNNTSGNWINIILKGKNGVNPDAINATVKLTQGSHTRIKQKICGEAHASQSSQVMHFGLGETKLVEKIEIQFNSKLKYRFTNLEVNNTYVISSNGSIEKIEYLSKAE